MDDFQRRLDSMGLSGDNGGNEPLMISDFLTRLKQGSLRPGELSVEAAERIAKAFVKTFYGHNEFKWLVSNQCGT